MVYPEKMRKKIVADVLNPTTCKETFTDSLRLWCTGYSSVRAGVVDMAKEIQVRYGIVLHPTTLRKYVDGSPRDPDWRTVACVMGVMLDL